MPQNAAMAAAAAGGDAPDEQVAVQGRPARKISEVIAEHLAEGKTTVSFEFFPAKTAAGVDNLLGRVERMGMQLQPTFVTLTWRSAFKDESLWLRIGSHIQNEFQLDVLLHLTCHLPREDLCRVLNNAKKAGIRNILALRGDPPIGEETWKPVPGGLSNAIDLVRLIREEHGDYFCVAVAGYPETHTECWNDDSLPPSQQAQDLDLRRLKEKVDAGADFIISQFFYDLDAYFAWADRCEAIGITVPILPGYMPIANFRGFKKFTTWCKTAVPAKVMSDLEAIKDDDAAVKAYGVELATAACRAILARGIKTLHFYTMNLAGSVGKVLHDLGLAPSCDPEPMPWAQEAPPRQGEQVRPIFWSKRQSSYLRRTCNWDDFPNGRWGDFRSPAYGELTDYYLGFKRPKSDRTKLWGVPQSEADIRKVFADYIAGSVSQLPWCESKLTAETSAISSHLRWLNEHGFLTINSQPRVNALPSDHPVHGWGGSGGYVFQKAYIEFFCDPSLFERLRAALDRFPTLTYHAVRACGHEQSNTFNDRANAVTWGVFPGREILQPTVVDPASFRAWKSEAFSLWLTQWRAAYTANPKKDERYTTAAGLIQQVHDTYYLVNVVDNDYVSDVQSIFAVFREVVRDGMGADELRGTVSTLEQQTVTLQEQSDRLSAACKEAEAETQRALSRVATLEAQNAQLRARVRELEAAGAQRA